MNDFNSDNSGHKDANLIGELEKALAEAEAQLKDVECTPIRIGDVWTEEEK